MMFKISKINFISFLLLLLAFQAAAFENKKIIYESIENPAKKVYFEFKGEVFDPPLDLFEGKEPKQPEVKRVFVLFKKFYELNKAGKKKEMLMLWNPSERAQQEKDFDDETLKKNQNRFKAITGMKLKMIIEYGGYYICYMRVEFAGNKVVMKYPLIQSKKNMFLSNGLNGDYFYDAVSGFLDKENYMDAAGQIAK